MFLGYFAGHMYRLALAGLPALLKMFSLWLEAFISIPCGLRLTIKKKKKIAILLCPSNTRRVVIVLLPPQHPDPVGPLFFFYSISFVGVGSWISIFRFLSLYYSQHQEQHRGRPLPRPCQRRHHDSLGPYFRWFTLAPFFFFSLLFDFYFISS